MSIVNVKMARRLRRRSVGGVLASSFDKKAVQLSPATPQLVLGDQHARFHVLILCGMHGDERDPIDAVNQLVRDGLFDAVDKAAKITLLLGNAQAVREGVSCHNLFEMHGKGRTGHIATQRQQ